MSWKSWTSRAGRSPRAPGSVSRFVAMSSAAAPATSESAAFSSIASAVESAASRRPRGASRTAWRCSSVRREAMAGKGVLLRGWHGVSREPRALYLVSSLSRIDSLASGILSDSKELVDLVPVRHSPDGGVRVRRRLARPDDVRADEEDEFRPLEVLRAAAEDIADDRDLVEEAELALVGREPGALQPPEDRHLAVLHVDERRGLAVADDRLLVAVDSTLPWSLSTVWSMFNWMPPSSPISGVTLSVMPMSL